MEKKDIRDILEQLPNGGHSEQQGLMAKLWLFQLNNKKRAAVSESELDNSKAEVWQRLESRLISSSRSVKLWPRIVAVAAASAILVLSVYFFSYDRKIVNNSNDLLVQNIAPGKVGATLTLASGKKIKLDDAAKGNLANEAGVSIRKTADGQLVYQVMGNSADGTHNHILSTSAGEVFRVNLPDGSSVWLNAMSSLTYSTNLGTAAQRKVTLNGEGYFKVAKNPERPFIVQTAKQEIKVLGTEFNVNSYPDDEAETTTLIHGSIAMRTDNDRILLKPGEQGVVKSGKINTSIANIYAAVGWKNNEFVFASEDIKAIMKLIARWYDVGIEYQGDLTSDKISGSISRFADIHSAIEIIEGAGHVKIHIEGKKLIVSDPRK